MNAGDDQGIVPPRAQLCRGERGCAPAEQLAVLDCVPPAAAPPCRPAAPGAAATVAHLPPTNPPTHPPTRGHNRLGQLRGARHPDGLPVEERAAAAHCGQAGAARGRGTRRRGDARAGQCERARSSGRLKDEAQRTAQSNTHPHDTARPVWDYTPRPPPVLYTSSTRQRSPAWYSSPSMGLNTTPTTGCLATVSPMDTQEKG